MTQSTPLQQDTLLQRKHKHGRNIRIHEDEWYLVESREVVCRRESLKRRLWGLLPVKVTQAISVPLPIPADITTEEELREYLAYHKVIWRKEV